MNLGDEMFEVTDMASLYAEVQIPQKYLLELKTEMKGELNFYSNRYDALDCRVSKILPAVHSNENEEIHTFKVFTEYQNPQWVRPGMQGLAEIKLGRLSLAALFIKKLKYQLKYYTW